MQEVEAHRQLEWAGGVISPRHRLGHYLAASQNGDDHCEVVLNGRLGPIKLSLLLWKISAYTLAL